MEVGVGFHIVDFGRITAREETFDVTAHLELRWRDPRLAGGVVGGGMWTPRLNFDNAAEAPRPHGEPEIEVDPDGRVTSRSIISGKFSTPLDLRKFPFDAQDLVVRISLFHDRSKVRFAPIPEAMHMHDDASITDWSLLEQTYRVDSRRYRPDGEEYSVVAYLVRAKRRSTFYVWRVLLPLTLLSLIPTLVFWFEPTNLQPQISTCMGTLIAMLAFGYSVDFALPKVAYLTIVDRHAMVGFLAATAATIAVTVIHRSVAVGAVPAALKAQRRLRLLYPAAYLAVVGLSFGLFMSS
ncbi:Cys-loop ligand-gated ion channel [Planctomyces sp. SH-PL62]|nr:Cys-loop ligand-gated ion channel [Planctomyces sp. SH-PL62]